MIFLSIIMLITKQNNRGKLNDKQRNENEWKAEGFDSY